MLHSLRRLALSSLLVAGLAALALAAPRLYALARYSPRVVASADAPHRPVAVVFGAGLTRSGNVSTVLYDRVATAADLYHAGKVQVLLFSGQTTVERYSEPEAMRRAALDLGIPGDAIWLDGAGLSTYDTCYRARAVFGLEQVVLVTQAFHLPRALYLCDALGVEALGVAADRRTYRERSQAFWNLREFFATAAAWWDLNVARPAPNL
jgi:SanA protein